MATSGSVYSSYGDDSRLYVDWQQKSQSIENNTTTIAYQFGIQNGNYWYTNAVKITSVYINGTKVSSGGTYSNITTQGKVQKGSGTVTIPHNSSDGSKSFAISISGWFYGCGNKSGSSSFTLTTIPRVSDLSLNKTSVPADGATTVIATATKKSSSFTDTITVTLGSYSMTVTSGEAFTIPMSWINAISGTSATATVKVTTKSGSTTIGTKSVNLTVTVPDSVVPVINDISVSEAVAKVTDAFGDRFVKGLSQLNVEVDASGIYSSTVKSYSTALDGVTYIQNPFTSNVLNAAGILTVKAKITDSRGRTAEATKELTVIDYMPPAIPNISYYQCDSDGTQNSNGSYTKVIINYKVYPVEGQNTKELKLSYKKVTEEVYTERIVTLNDWEGSSEVIISDTSTDVTYEYIAELTDKISTSSQSITTGINVLSLLAGGGGAAFFGEAEEEGFVVKSGYPATFTGDILMEVDEEFQTLWNSVFGSSGGVVKLLDFIYPIGHILETTNADFNPNNWYTWQTWEMVAQGRTLYGAGTLNGITYNAGETVDAGLPNITGSIGTSGSGEPKFANTVTGCFSAIAKTSYYSATTDKSGFTRTDGFNFNASGSNAIYGKSTTVQPNAYVVYIWERTA